MNSCVYDKVDGLYLLPNPYGFLQDTDMYFDKEKIHALIETFGRIAFTDDEGKVLAETKVEANTDDDKHSGGYCQAKDGKVFVYLNITGYKDTYPNCDGEHDRWVSVIV